MPNDSAANYETIFFSFFYSKQQNHFWLEIYKKNTKHTNTGLHIYTFKNLNIRIHTTNNGTVWLKKSV